MREIHPVLERLARAIADDSRDSYDNYLPWPVAVSHARAAVQALMDTETTYDMHDAGDEFVGAHGDAGDADKVFKAMLSAILEGGK